MKTFLMLGFLFFASVNSAGMSNLDKIYQQSLPTICEVVGYDNESGFFTWQAFFIHSNGLLLTSRLPPLCQSFYCYWRDEEGELDMLEGRLISEHPEYDVALIKVDCRENKKFPVTMVDFSPQKQGEWFLRVSIGAKYQIYKPSICSISSYALIGQEGFLPHQGIVDQGSHEDIAGAPYLNLNGNVVALHNRSEKRFSTFTALHPLQDWLSELLLENEI